LVVSVAVVGSASTKGAVRRSGARPGDKVFVTGSLGGAASALSVLRGGGIPPRSSLARLRRPAPRIDEGLAAAEGHASSMIDVSDGLAGELAHLCQESGVGMRLDARAIPVAPGASLEQALGGGDDYELVFTAPDAATVRRSFARRGLVAPSAVGEVVAGGGLVLVDDSREEPLAAAGWEHRTAPRRIGGAAPW
ncbi:MAG: thiamine-phosphate kinase, partial [Acidimicrobiia bacterium]